MNQTLCFLLKRKDFRSSIANGNLKKKYKLLAIDHNGSLLQWNKENNLRIIHTLKEDQLKKYTTITMIDKIVKN